MDYERVYQRFISDRRRREAALLEFERHHVLPRHFGGDDSPENLLRLSLQDHLFAHVLLAKIHGGQMANCARRMASMGKYRGRLARNRYAELRRAAVETLRECQRKAWAAPGSPLRTEAYREKQSRAHFGNTHGKALRGKRKSEDHKAKIRAALQSEEFRAQQSARLKGRRLSPEHVEKLRAALKGKAPTKEVAEAARRARTGSKLSAETRAKMSLAHKGQRGPMTGKRMSEETRTKMSESQRLRRIKERTAAAG